MIDWKASADRGAEECVPLSFTNPVCAFCGAKLDGMYRNYHQGPVTDFTFEAISTKPMTWDEVVAEWPTENPPGDATDWPPNMTAVAWSSQHKDGKEILATTFKGARIHSPTYTPPSPPPPE